ncbi:MAG: hypothetical protein ACTSY1_09030 [Alphaproteobacteria bacterium]
MVAIFMGLSVAAQEGCTWVFEACNVKEHARVGCEVQGLSETGSLLIRAAPQRDTKVYTSVKNGTALRPENESGPYIFGVFYLDDGRLVRGWASANYVKRSRCVR